MKYIISFFLICVLLSSCNNTAPVDMEKATQEANDFIASQFDFFTESSLELAKETFAEDAILIGTDAAEYLSGWAEIEPSVKAQLAIKDPVFSARKLNIFMADAGDMASYTQELDFTFNIGGEAGEVKNVRNSGVIKKIDGQWKVVQIHWSIGLEGQAVEYEMPE